MARYSPRKRELREQSLHALGVLRDVRIDLAVRSFEVRVGYQPWPAVARTGDVNDVEIVPADQPVHVDINEIQAGRRAPVPQQTRLDVFGAQRLPQEWIIEKVDLSYGK